MPDRHSLLIGMSMGAKVDRGGLAQKEKKHLTPQSGPAVQAAINDLQAKVNLFNVSHGTFSNPAQASWDDAVIATRALADSSKADSATLKQNAQTALDKITAFSAQRSTLDTVDQAGLDAIVQSANDLADKTGITNAAATPRPADLQFGNPGPDATTLGIRNFWEKVMVFSRTHGTMSTPDRGNLDGIVVAAATLISEGAAIPDVNRTRVQLAVTAVDKFNFAHGTLQHPDYENWDAIVGAVNALATAAGAGTGTVKRP